MKNSDFIMNKYKCNKVTVIILYGTYRIVTKTVTNIEESACT